MLWLKKILDYRDRREARLSSIVSVAGR